jgi:putative oxidoreductase
MRQLISRYQAATDRLNHSEWLLPTLARLVFAGVLLIYYLNSALTKVGDGLWGFLSPSAGGYAQIFPRAMEAVSYDVEALSAYHWLVVVAGTVGEFVLPVLIVVGLLTRLAALGMISFITLQSLTDIHGHAQADSIGSWFDRFADAAILDQRALWVFLLVVLVIKGAGPISFDRALRSSLAAPHYGTRTT